MLYRRRLKHLSDSGPVWRALAAAMTFMTLLGAAVAMEVLPAQLLVIYLAASIVAFMAYWHDKSAARKSRWRTAESTLHAIGLLGGWPGSLVAMQVFRHKSSKASFQFAFWVTVAVNCGVLVWLAWSSGPDALASLLGMA